MSSSNKEQEDAAAAWRAARSQKSCLHSDKPDENGGSSKGGGDASSPNRSSFEATWRAGTLPFRLAHNSLSLNWKSRTRPTWNKQLDQAVTGLKTCYSNTPLNMSMIRMFTDRAVPSGAVPEGVKRLSQDLGGNLKVGWMYPESLDHHADAERFILYVHPPTCTMAGTTVRSLAGRLSLACNAAVLTVDYRAPPENDRAESLDDLDKAYKWLITQPGVAPAKLFLMADGLGAPLAVGLMINIRDRSGSAGTLPAACSLMSPWVDLEDKSPSWAKNAATDYVDRRVWDYFAQGYAGLLPLSDPQVSPMNATLSGLPPMMISVGSCEVLYDQCVAFVQKLEDAGVIVELDEGEDMVHASQIFASEALPCQAGILRIGSFARKMAPGHLFVNAQVDIGGSADLFKAPPQ